MTDASISSGLQLVPFDPRRAATIAGWVASDDELRWLAPSTVPPLTAAKVSKWPKENGRAFFLAQEADAEPIGYGELNPMQGDASQMWLGHVIIRPDARGRGMGREFVRLQVAYAFEELSASRVSLIVFPENTAAVRCYRLVGFTQTGDEYHQFNASGPKERLLRFEIHAYRSGDFQAFGNSGAVGGKVRRTV